MQLDKTNLMKFREGRIMFIENTEETTKEMELLMDAEAVLAGLRLLYMKRTFPNSLECELKIKAIQDILYELTPEE
jgi:hypothetical protein